jgi:tetratricopeptide (TPR) repeat protein
MNRTSSHRQTLRWRLPRLGVLGAALVVLAWSVFLLRAQTRHAVSLRIIVVGSASEAQQVLDRLKHGEDFATLAREKSTDSTASDGGYMGELDPATLRSELRDALQNVAPGQITGMVKIPSGYAILKVMPEQAQPSESKSANQLLPLSARGSIRYSTNVGGAPEADAAFQAFNKPDGWQQDLKAICQIRQQSLAANVDRLQEMTTRGSPPGSPINPADLMQMRFALGQLQAYQGHMAEAIAAWEEAYNVGDEIPGALPQLEESLGTAYLHKSEMENGAYTAPGESCLFPPRKPAAYKTTADSEKAIQYLLKYLERKPDDFEGRWMLNLAYMTLGKYPAGVPAQYRIAPASFASKEDVGRFPDVAPAAGLDLVSMAGGVIVDDFDNDGLLDVVTSSYNMCEHMHFFHNNGDGTFSDRSEQAGLLDQLGGLNIVQADYNNDGCMDILVLRGGWQWPMRRSLLQGHCNGTFTDVTKESGLAEPLAASQTAVWADIDNDGWLDLFVGNEKGPLQLFHNKGNGTFEEIGHAVGIDKSGFAKGITSADYDNDGYPDFYVSNLNGEHYLFHNNHNLTFTEVARQAGIQNLWASFPTWFFDYDNDGWPDLFVASYYMSVDEVMRSALGQPCNAETLKLYKNLGNGTFRDVTKEVGLDRVFMPMGANFGDVDNDGFLDIYLGNGNPSYTSMTPHVLLRNQEGKLFVDITASSGTGELHKGHGVAFADIDNDGDEDILTLTGGAIPGDAHPFRLFENPGQGNDWLSVKLVGVKTNRSAIGARIKVTVQNEGRTTRDIYRTVTSGGSFGASPLQQHIGLGKSAKILNLEIWWPTSNTRQNFPSVAKNQFIEIKEFAKDYTKLTRAPFKLGGARRTGNAAWH